MVDIQYVSGGPRVQVYEDVSFQAGVWTPAGNAALDPGRLQAFLRRAKDPDHFQVRFSDAEKRVMEVAGFKDDPEGYLRDCVAKKRRKAFEPEDFIRTAPPDPAQIARAKAAEEAARKRAAEEEAALDVLPPDTGEDATYYCGQCGHGHIARTHVGRSHYKFRGIEPPASSSPIKERVPIPSGRRK